VTVACRAAAHGRRRRPELTSTICYSAASDRTSTPSIAGANGRDLRGLLVLERKRRLRAILPVGGSRVLYLDHVVELGTCAVPAAPELTRFGSRRRRPRGDQISSGVL
jgi:hypothetical protein